MLVVAGCSSDSGSDDGRDRAPPRRPPSESASPSPTVRGGGVHDASRAVQGAVEEDAGGPGPEGQVRQGGHVRTTPRRRGSCSWSSLDNNGVKGSQFRWLERRRCCASIRTSRAARATSWRTDVLRRSRSRTPRRPRVPRSSKPQPVSGIGDEATAVRYDLKKKEGSFKQRDGRGARRERRRHRRLQRRRVSPARRRPTPDTLKDAAEGGQGGGGRGGEGERQRRSSAHVRAAPRPRRRRSRPRSPVRAVLEGAPARPPSQRRQELTVSPAPPLRHTAQRRR